MVESGHINLLRAKTGHSAEFDVIAVNLRRVGVLTTLLVIVLGILLGSGYTVLRMQLLSLTEQKKQLITELTGKARKETLLLVLKNQIGLTKKVLETQKPWGAVTESVFRIASPPALASFILDDKQEMTMQIRAGSIEEAADIIGRTMKEFSQNHIKNPTLQQLSFSGKGNVEMTLSFIPVH